MAPIDDIRAGESGARPNTTQTTPQPPVYWRDLPNKPQLLLLALCRLSEPLSNTCLLPYIYPLTRAALSPTTTTTTNDSTIALYSGLLVAIFPLAQAIVALPWSHLSAHHRRPSILTGLLLSTLANTGFAFSKSICWLFIFRALAGVANGNVGLMRAMTAELVPDRRLQTRAFLVLPLVFNGGMVAGLALGGVLAEVKLVKGYPFALPALMNAMVLGAVLVLAVLGLRETALGKEGRDDVGLRAGRWLRGVFGQRGAVGYRVLRGEDLEDGIPLDDESKPATQPSPTLTARPSPPPLPFHAIWTPQTLTALTSFALLPLHNASFMHLFPLLLSQPPSPSPFTGGLGLPSHKIGLSLSLLGFLAILLQLYIYPRLHTHFNSSTLAVLRLALLLFPMAYTLAPFLSQTTPGSVGSWALLLVVAATQIAARTLAIPSTVVLLTEAAPAKSALGTVHGAGHMVACLARAVGPAVGGWMFAHGVRVGWWLFLVPVAAVAGWWGWFMQQEVL